MPLIQHLQRLANVLVCCSVKRVKGGDVVVKASLRGNTYTRVRLPVLANFGFDMKVSTSPGSIGKLPRTLEGNRLPTMMG
jgi:hypothetical protein